MRLNNRISIEKFIEEKQNSDGFDEEVWDEQFYTCWAGVKRISGSEFIAAKATNSENVVTFTVRYCEKTCKLLEVTATKEFRIKFNECDYDIVYCNDYSNSHNWIDVKAIRIN